MESLNVTYIRNLARGAMEGSGARGFMRFAQEGEALLICDAAARCADGGQALCQALEAAGFTCRAQGALLMIAPVDALLERMAADVNCNPVDDWGGELRPAQTLASRLLRAPREALTPQGRAYAMQTARLLWRPQAQVLAGIDGLRAQAAALLRAGDRSGFALAGGLLANWCEQKKGENAR